MDKTPRIVRFASKLRINPRPSVLSTEWYPPGVRSNGYTGGFKLAFVFQCNRGHLVYAVPAGSYFLGKAFGGSVPDYVESDTVRFTVHAGKVNYVGDFYIAVDDRGSVKYVSPPVVRDRSAAARKALENIASVGARSL